MTLYECTNGAQGQSYCRVYVVAPDEAAAHDMAQQVFKKAAEDFNRQFPNSPYEDDYWSDIRVEEICGDVSQPWASNVKH